MHVSFGIRVIYTEKIVKQMLVMNVLIIFGKIVINENT